MALDYTGYVNQIVTIMATSAANANFVTILPGAIDYAEQRIYRDLDLLSTVVRDSSASFTPPSRDFSYPTTLGRFITVQQINVIVPAGSTPDQGSRVRLTPTTREYLDSVFGSAASATIPHWFAPITDATIIVGAWPDQAYVVEVVGTIRPTPLSEANTTTFLSSYLPDMLIAASMIYMSGYMRNFGSQSDDPRMSLSWEGQYNSLLSSARAEEMRKKFAAGSWTAYSAPIGKEQ